MSTRALTWAFDVIAQTGRLTASQRLVLLTLAHHHNSRTDQCTPSMARIGARCGLTERAARLAIRDLEHIGLITSHKRVDHTGQTSNQYVLFGSVRNGSGRNKKTDRGRNGASGGAGGTPVPPNRKDSLGDEGAGATAASVRSPIGGDT